jgi:hypothetical protein
VMASPGRKPMAGEDASWMRREGLELSTVRMINGDGYKDDDRSCYVLNLYYV